MRSNHRYESYDKANLKDSSEGSHNFLRTFITEPRIQQTVVGMSSLGLDASTGSSRRRSWRRVVCPCSYSESHKSRQAEHITTPVITCPQKPPHAQWQLGSQVKCFTADPRPDIYRARGAHSSLLPHLDNSAPWFLL